MLYEVITNNHRYSIAAVDRPLQQIVAQIIATDLRGNQTTTVIKVGLDLEIIHGNDVFERQPVDHLSVIV